VTALRALSIETRDDHKPIQVIDWACDRALASIDESRPKAGVTDASNGLRSSSLLRFSLCLPDLIKLLAEE
jgi:hypothetical protein